MEKQRSSSGERGEGNRGRDSASLLGPTPSLFDGRDLVPASLTFHGILLGSHDVDQGALQGVHVQAVVHSGAVLQNTKRAERKQGCQSVRGVFLRLLQITRARACG